MYLENKLIWLIWLIDWFIKFILANNKFCFSGVGITCWMKAEYFHTSLTFRTSLLEGLKKWTDIWGYLQVHWGDPEERFLLLCCEK